MLDKRQNGTFSQSPANHLEKEAREILASIAADMISRKKYQDVFRGIIDQVLNNWAGTSKWRQRSGNTVKRILPGILERISQTSDDVDTAALFGRYLNLKWKAANAEADSKTDADRQASAAQTRKNLNSFLKNIDLGELDERLLKNQDAMVAQAGNISEIIGEQFGKLGTLAPIGVTLTNTIIRSLDHLLDPAVKLPPDLATVLLSTIIQQIDGEALVRVLNKKNELIRMIHIGSLLEGDGTVSNIEASLYEKLKSAMAGIDPEAYTKMRVGEIANSSAVESAKLNALKDTPELARKEISLLPHVQNAKIHLAQKKMAALENLGDETCTGDMAEALSQIDAEGLSDLINEILKHFYDLRTQKSNVVNRWLTRVATDIDMDLLTECAQLAIQDMVEAMGPVLSGVAPMIVKGFYDLLKAPGEADTTADVTELLNNIVSASR